MLTPDLLPVRRKDGELHLTPLVGKSRRQLLELAEQVEQIAKSALGNTREQLQGELLAVGQTPAESRLVRGLAKLVEDATTFEQDRGRGAAERREILFERAADAWQALAEGQAFERKAVLAQAAAHFGLAPDQFEAELFVDLPAAQRVLAVVPWNAEQLVERYEQARIAAVLLRAASVRVTFRISSVLEVRQLFRTLKFRQLMFEIERLADGRYQLTLTGPYSLFESVTKYGLQLALCWPELSLLDDLMLEAELRWGKRNERLRFVLDERKRRRQSVGPGQRVTTGPTQTDEVSTLRQALQEQLTDGSVVDGDAVLELPGVGLCVPDLCCVRGDGTRIHVEVLGYWSRDAVWKRVELVEAGLVEPVLFVVPGRLRVSEEVLDKMTSGALYVYRGRINAATVVGKLNELAGRQRHRC